MAKQDVLDAINATIAPNNIKGITAESLNNVLTMMAENAGEGGSGDGALRIMVPMLAAGFLELGEFSLTSWEETKTILETDLPGVDLSEMDAAVSAMIAHNAEVAQQLIEKSKAGQGVSVILDQTLFAKAYVNLMLQVDPDAAAVYEDYLVGGSQSASYSMVYMKLTPEVEAQYGVSEEAMFALSPIGCPLSGDGDIVHYQEWMLLYLELDGSILFPEVEEEPSSGSGVVTFYTTISGEITEEQKEKNVAAFSKYAAGIPVSVIVNEEVEATYHPFVTMYQENKDGASGLSFIACNFPFKKSDGSYASMLFYEDGSVIMQME